jgi:hypothetical protein
MIKRIILITVCLLPAVALAEPSTQHGQKNSHNAPPFKKPTSRPSDDQEFNQALAFLQRMSPNRFKAYESLDADRQGIFRERIVAFWRGNQWMTWGPPGGNDMRIVRERVIKAEDDVFAIRWEILAAGGPRKASDEDRSRLRSAVADMVKIQLEERNAATGADQEIFEK